MLSTKAENGRSLDYFDDGDSIPSMEQLRKQYPLSIMREQEPLSAGAEETSQSNQRSVLIKRGFMKAKRDSVSISNIMFENTSSYWAKWSLKFLYTPICRLFLFPYTSVRSRSNSENAINWLWVNWLKSCLKWSKEWNSHVNYHNQAEDVHCPMDLRLHRIP